MQVSSLTVSRQIWNWCSVPVTTIVALIWHWHTLYLSQNNNAKKQTTWFTCLLYCCTFTIVMFMGMRDTHRHIVITYFMKNNWEIIQIFSSVCTTFFFCFCPYVYISLSHCCLYITIFLPLHTQTLDLHMH